MKSSYVKISLLVIFVLILILGLTYWKGIKDLATIPSGEAGEFRGTLVQASDNQIVLEGVFTSPPQLAGDLKGEHKFVVNFSEDTVFKKLVINMPKADGKPVDVKDLPRQDLSGSISDIKSYGTSTPVMLFIKFNFSNKDLSTALASEVKYQLFTEPKI